MKLAARNNVRFLFAAALVLISLSVATHLAWLRLKPEVSAIAWIAGKPDYESHVVNIHQRAKERVQPGSADAYLPIYDVQNPGLFLLVAEVFARVGANSPMPLQILSIILFDIGALCFFCWVWLLFDDAIVAALATAFLALSQFFLFFPGVTHTMPFEFAFFNITLLLFALYLRKDKPVYLAGALVAMFLTCMNYWFYYMSSWIIMIGLWWQYRGRPRIRDIALISAPPIAAAASTTMMVMALFGGIRNGGLRLLDIFVARTFDARIPGGAWYPDQRFMTAADWLNYPSLVRRLEWAYNIDFRLFAFAAGCALLLLWLRKRSSALSALILLAGGFSWYCVMFQHTHIHHFVGQYSFMAICPIFGLVAGEAIISARTALRLLRGPFALRGNDAHVGYRMGIHVVAAVLIVTATQQTIRCLERSYGLVKESLSLSHSVEVKYRQALKDICAEHSEVKLSDLEQASKNWGLDWRPKQLADTNQMPKCSG
jgi:hypothetical protein